MGVLRAACKLYATLTAAPAAALAAAPDASAALAGSHTAAGVALQDPGVWQQPPLFSS